MSIINDIYEKRTKEIDNYENAMTSNPIYVVYDVIEMYSECDSQYDQSTTLFDYNDDIKYLSEIDSELVSNNDDIDEKVRVSYHDRFVTVNFTRQGANDYIKLNYHNLYNPKIFVHHVPERNQELSNLLKLIS